MDIQALIETIVEQVKRVDGVCAIVLGGSRARGTHTPGSDVDLGIYYHPDQPLDLKALDQVAAFTLLAADRPSLEAAIDLLAEVQRDTDRLVAR